MSDIMKAIGILQAMRDMLRAKQPGLCWGDLSEEIQQLRHAITLLSPPADDPAGEPGQHPEMPPEFGPWVSCVDGIDAEDGDWIVLAWKGEPGWQYYALQVSFGRNDEDGSYSFGLLDLDGDDFMWDTSDYYMRIKR